jgi:hydroxylysine kinase
MTSIADPLRVIAAEPPRFSESDAVGIAARHYGLDVSAAGLVSERDCNFHLRDREGRQFVLKIASRAEDPVVTDFQVQALRYIEGREPDIATPRVVPALDGRLLLAIRSEEADHAVRLVTYLPGILLAGQPLTAELCRNLGIFAAKLGNALCGFEHPGSDPDLIWNMNHALRVRDIAHHIPDDSLRADVVRCIGYFETNVLPAFPSLRTQVVHNDMNPENVLLDPEDASRVAGVIDFGDMARGPLVVDVAVTGSYMREFAGNPLAKIAAFVSAYHSITPLERREIDLIYDLIRVRLATTVSVLHWRIAERGADDPYLNNSVSAESTAGRFLEVLEAVPREHACQALRQACASTDAAIAREAWRKV